MGTREALVFTPRLVAALGGNPIRHGAPPWRSNPMPARCFLRLSENERQLVAGFRDGEAGSHIPSAAVMYDLLVPIAAALLAAESSRYGSAFAIEAEGPRSRPHSRATAECLCARYL